MKASAGGGRFGQREGAQAAIGVEGGGSDGAGAVLEEGDADDLPFGNRGPGVVRKLNLLLEPGVAMVGSEDEEGTIAVAQGGKRGVSRRHAKFGSWAAKTPVRNGMARRTRRSTWR